MKRISALLVALCSLSICAQANRVGDSVKFIGTMNAQPVELDMEYTAYDGQSMTQSTQLKMSGQIVSDNVESIAPEAIVTMETVGLMIAMCSQIGGVHEYLDLPVGKTLTCKVSADSVSTPVYNMYKSVFMDASTIWLGPFPVSGIAQMIFGGSMLRVSHYHWN